MSKSAIALAGNLLAQRGYIVHPLRPRVWNFADILAASMDRREVVLIQVASAIGFDAWLRDRPLANADLFVWLCSGGRAEVWTLKADGRPMRLPLLPD